MYWTESEQDSIRRDNLDGTSIETLWTETGRDPFRLVLDTAGGKMYWTNADDIAAPIRTVQASRAFWAGTGAGCLVLDTFGGKMYW